MIKPRLAENAYPLLAGGLSTIGSLPLLLSSQTVPGEDAISHVAKTAFLVYSWEHGNLLGWSQFWYSGFQMFYTYSPLTYVLAGALGILSGSAALGMQVVIVSSFILSGVGAFVLSRDFGIPEVWSLVASLLYSLASPHVLILFLDGSLTYALAFALLPWLLLSVRLALRKPSVHSTVVLGAVIALLVVSNSTTAYVVSFPFLAYVVLRTRKGDSKSIAALLASVAVGFLLSAFWLLPYLGLDLSGQLNLFTEAASGTYPSANVIHWYSFFIPNQNMSDGDVGWVLLLPALGSIVFLRSREEFAFFGAALVAVLMTIGPTLTPLFYRIPLVLALQFAWRFLIADVAFLTPLAALFFWRVGGRLGAGGRRFGGTRSLCFVVVALLVVSTAASLLIVNGSFSQTQQTPSNPDMKTGLNFVAGQPGFFRVMAISRYFESFPEFTLKGSIDGWYDEATTQAYRNFTFNVYYCGPTARSLGGLRLLGARYVMIDYPSGGDAKGASLAYNSSASVLGPPVFEDGQVVIYQVPDSSLVYVTSSMPNSNFSLSQDVDCFTPIPSAPASQVEHSLSNLAWGETEISFDVTVRQPAYVLVSNAYSAGWAATDNGTAAPIAVSPPGLPVIHVSPGTNHIVLSYSSGPVERYSAPLSAVAALGMISTLVLRGRSTKPPNELGEPTG